VPSRVSTFFGLPIIYPVIISVASSGVIAGNMSYIRVGAIIGVRTNGMLIVVKWTLSSFTSEAITRLKASRAAFEATYAAPGYLMFWRDEALMAQPCNAHRLVVKTRAGDGIERPRQPIAGQNDGERDPLPARRTETQQEKEGIAQANLRKRIFECEIRLAALHGSQEDS
jgi:hypothetical protein